jgi:hypothetical protein
MIALGASSLKRTPALDHKGLARLLAHFLGHRSG